MRAKYLPKIYRVDGEREWFSDSLLEVLMATTMLSGDILFRLLRRI